MLLFSLLLDDCVSPKLWNIFHDLFIDEESMQLIRKQSQILIEALQSLETWQLSKYSKFLRIVNNETLQLLRTYIAKYTDDSKDSEHYNQMRSGTNEIYSKHYGEDSFNSTLTRSFGVLAPDSVKIAPRVTQQFWGAGLTDLRDWESNLYAPIPYSPLQDLGEVNLRFHTPSNPWRSTISLVESRIWHSNCFLQAVALTSF